MRERDWTLTTQEIAGFIRRTAGELKRDGALLGLSGGLDSTTVACLCARALGRDRVLGLIMPEKEVTGPSVEEAQRCAEWLGIRSEVVDLTPQLEALGAYNFIVSRLPGRALKASVVRATYRCF